MKTGKNKEKDTEQGKKRKNSKMKKRKKNRTTKNTGSGTSRSFPKSEKSGWKHLEGSQKRGWWKLKQPDPVEQSLDVHHAKPGQFDAECVQ